jgi:hypothetical protein
MVKPMECTGIRAHTHKAESSTCPILGEASKGGHFGGRGGGCENGIFKFLNVQLFKIECFFEINTV